MTTIRLTNGEETFTLESVINDERGPAHGKDWTGAGYTRCDIGASCDHPADKAVWHDDENTETLWEVN